MSEGGARSRDRADKDTGSARAGGRDDHVGPKGGDPVLALQALVGNAATDSVLRGGTPLGDERSGLERLFGTHLGGIRMHTDAPLPRGVLAAAYDDHVLLGRDANALSPGHRAATVAHELAHVVQQRGGGTPDADAVVESEAHAAASAVLTGQPASVRATHGGPALLTWAEARHKLWQLIPPKVQETLRPLGAQAAKATEAVVPPSIQLPPAVNVVVEHAKARVTNAAHKVKKFASEKVRDKLLGEVGEAKGIAVEAAGLVDTVAWIPAAEKDLAKWGVQKAAALGVVTPEQAAVADRSVDYAFADYQSAVAAADQAGLVDKDEVTNPQGAITVSPTVARAFDWVAGKVEDVSGAGPEQADFLTEYELAELGGIAKTQIGLAVIGAKEVQLALKVVGAIGGVKALVAAVQREKDNWYKSFAFWASAFGLAASLMGLRNSRAWSKLVHVLATAGGGTAAVGAIIQLYTHWNDPELAKDPAHRDAVLHEDYRAVMHQLVALISAEISRRIQQQPGRAPNTQSPPAEHPPTEPEPAAAHPLPAAPTAAPVDPTTQALTKPAPEAPAPPRRTPTPAVRLRPGEPGLEDLGIGGAAGTPANDVTPAPRLRSIKGGGGSASKPGIAPLREPMKRAMGDDLTHDSGTEAPPMSPLKLVPPSEGTNATPTVAAGRTPSGSSRGTTTPTRTAPMPSSAATGSPRTPAAPQTSAAPRTPAAPEPASEPTPQRTPPKKVAVKKAVAEAAETPPTRVPTPEPVPRTAAKPEDDAAEPGKAVREAVPAGLPPEGWPHSPPQGRTPRPNVLPPDWDYQANPRGPARDWQPGDPVNMPDAEGTHLGWDTMRKRAWRTWATNELDLRAVGNRPDPEQLVHLNPIEELTDAQLAEVARTGVMPRDSHAEIEHARIPQRVGRLLVDVGIPETRARTLSKLGSSGNLEGVSKEVHAVLDQEAKKTGTPRNPTLPASIDDRIDFPLGSASNQEISDMVDATRDAVRARGPQAHLRDTAAGQKLHDILTIEKTRRGASATWTVPD
ncbi:eCIS core domain-containing protein [Kribbella sp. NPDC055110]